MPKTPKVPKFSLTPTVCIQIHDDRPVGHPGRQETIALLKKLHAFLVTEGIHTNIRTGAIELARFVGFYSAADALTIKTWLQEHGHVVMGSPRIEFEMLPACDKFKAFRAQIAATWNILGREEREEWVKQIEELNDQVHTRLGTHKVQVKTKDRPRTVHRAG